MGWRNDHLYGAETYDAMIHRVRAITDACYEGPTATLDTARAERALDFDPAPRRPSPRARAVPAGPSSTAGTPGNAGASTGGTCSRQRPAPALTDAA